MPASVFRLLMLGLLASRLVVATDAWTPIAPLPSAIADPLAATTLADGRVLVVGTAAGAADPLARAAAVWTPATDGWQTVATPPPGTGAPAVRLGDGTALFIGYRLAAFDSEHPMARSRFAEVYDPASDSWTTRGIANGFRSNGTLTALADGSALFFGGQESSGSSNAYPVVFRPHSGWTAPGEPLPSPGSAPDQPNGRYLHSMAALADGRALVAGGTVNGMAPYGQTDAHLFLPDSLSWDDGAVPELPQPRQGAGAVRLGDGSVLIIGGTTYDHFPSTDAAIRWHVGAPAWEPAGLPPFTIVRRLEAYGDGRAVALGEDNRVAFFDPKGGTWASGPFATGAAVSAIWVTLPDGGVVLIDASPRALRPQRTGEPPIAAIDVLDATLVVAADAQPTLDGEPMTAAGAGFWTGPVLMPGAQMRSVRVAVWEDAERSIEVVIDEE